MLAILAFTLLAVANPAPAPSSQPLILPPHEEKELILDAASKEQTVKPGQETANFVFSVKNVSKAPITIVQVRTSCGCTVATLPSKPWIVAPGAGGDIKLTVDLRGKSGTVFKTATIDTPTGFKNFAVTVNIPGSSGPMDEDMRLRNQRIAVADRQAVFKSDCASCHATPVRGKMGLDLYAAACAICHEAPKRATMVPDLRKLPHAVDPAFWKAIVTDGKAGTLMPGFGLAQGGPLTAAQIDSLVAYLTAAFPQQQQR